MPSEPVFERIRTLGFRRWYERQLIESHAWLAGCFISMILVAAGLELLTLENGFRDFAFDASMIGAGSVFGWVSWRRYAWLMVRAEAVGVQAVCPACRHYGFRFVALERGRLRARCPKCANQWMLDEPLGTDPP